MSWFWWVILWVFVGFLILVLIGGFMDSEDDHEE